MPLELTFLGTGTSAGIPMIGCDCAVCTSDDPRDRRDRASALVRWPDERLDVGAFHTQFNEKQAGHRQVLIDTAPELRRQAMRHRLSRIDGVFYTHEHADHIFGLDDLRRFNSVMNAPLDLYAERTVIEHLRRMFKYIFESHTNVNQSYVAKLIPHAVEPGEAIELHGAKWTPLRVMHGRLPILGYRAEHDGAAMAYCTDASTIPPETYPRLRELDVLVLDALRYRHHPTHMTIDRAVEVAQRVGAKRTLLTHLAHDVCHAAASEGLPAGVELAYDGLVVSLE